MSAIPQWIQTVVALIVGLPLCFAALVMFLLAAAVLIWPDAFEPHADEYHYHEGED